MKKVDFVVDTPVPTALLNNLSEEDLILILSELKIIVYGIPGSDVYTGLQFEACGVDSYSLSDRAMEMMSYAGVKPSDDLQCELADGLAKDIIFFIELTRWCNDVDETTSAHDVVKEMNEAYCMDVEDIAEHFIEEKT